MVRWKGEKGCSFEDVRHKVNGVLCCKNFEKPFGELLRDVSTF